MGGIFAGRISPGLHSIKLRYQIVSPDGLNEHATGKTNERLLEKDVKYSTVGKH